MAQPVVAVGSLGGTIAMTPDVAGAGVVPTLRAADLTAAVPSLAEVAGLRVTDLRWVPGASLVPDDLRQVLAWATAEVDGGAAGVVLTQGTDTLEETAYLLDLWWDRSAPLVLTGAMRPPGAPGADGPSNLFTAVAAAAAVNARDLGVLVAVHTRLHAAARVRKSHSTALDAFTSPDTGPSGMVEEGKVWLRPAMRRPKALPPPPRDGAAVALLETHLGDDGALLARVGEDGYDAVVVAAYGAGHLAGVVADVVEALAARLPVVIATRTGAGSTLRDTYGFPGSEIDLRQRGALFAGWLDPRKARLLTWAVLSSGLTRDRLARELADRGEAPA